MTQTINQVHDLVGDQVWPLQEIGGHLHDQVTDQIWYQVWEHTWSQVYDQVFDQIQGKVWDKILHEYPN